MTPWAFNFSICRPSNNKMALHGSPGLRSSTKFSSHDDNEARDLYYLNVEQSMCIVPASVHITITALWVPPDNITCTSTGTHALNRSQTSLWATLQTATKRAGKRKEKSDMVKYHCYQNKQVQTERDKRGGPLHARRPDPNHPFTLRLHLTISNRSCIGRYWLTHTACWTRVLMTATPQDEDGKLRRLTSKVSTNTARIVTSKKTNPQVRLHVEALAPSTLATPIKQIRPSKRSKNQVG